MKKTYIKPTMMVVEIKHHSILCTSPNGYRSVQVYSDPLDEIDDENEVY